MVERQRILLRRLLLLLLLLFLLLEEAEAHAHTKHVPPLSSAPPPRVVSPRDGLVVITSPDSSQRTLVDVREGVTVFLVGNECHVARTPLRGGGGEAGASSSRFSSSSSSSSSDLNRSGGHDLGTLYASSVVPRDRMASELGPRLAAWCRNRQTWRLSRSPPTLPSYNDYLRSYAANHTLAYAGGHRRPKRGAGRKTRRQRSPGKKGKGRKRSKKSKKGLTKALKRGKKRESLAPRLEFPAAHVTKDWTEEVGDSESSSGRVVLQEEPYLSPSFVRPEEGGQGFRHYRDFYQEAPEGATEEEEAAAEGRDVRRGTRGRIDIPDTIIKDGQVFYRYDAEEDAARDRRRRRKEQSKRSHRGSDGAFLRDDADFVLTADEQAANGVAHDALADIVPLGGDYLLAADYGFGSDDYSLDPLASRAQTQAQMGGGSRAASADAQVDPGHAVQVQGSTSSGGFFSAQAQSLGPRGMSQTQVQGNQHGVQGSALIQGRGHGSQAQVQMGPNSLSAAQVDHAGGSLSSLVQATPFGGSAEAATQGVGTSAAQAHMDFHPGQQYLSTGEGIHGQGAASAASTAQGSSSVASLTGDVPSGSYLGTALSSTFDDAVHYDSSPEGLQAEGGVAEASDGYLQERGEDAHSVQLGNANAIVPDASAGDPSLGFAPVDYSDFDLGGPALGHFPHEIRHGQDQALFVQGQQLPPQGIEDDGNAYTYDYPSWEEDARRRQQELVFVHDQFGHEGLAQDHFDYDLYSYGGQDLSHTLPIGQVDPALEEGSAGVGHRLHGTFVQTGEPSPSVGHGDEDSAWAGLGQDLGVGAESVSPVHESLQDLSLLHPQPPPAQHGAAHAGPDMLGSILETVHQPEMPPPVAAFPGWPLSAHDDRLVDSGGLHGGAGIPPRESEVEQSPIAAGTLEEGGGREDSLDDGGLALAPLSSGGIRPLVPGQLLNVPAAALPSYYDYDYRYEAGDYEPRFQGELEADYEDSFAPSDYDAFAPTPPPHLVVHQVQSTPQVGGLPPSVPPPFSPDAPSGVVDMPDVFTRPAVPHVTLPDVLTRPADPQVSMPDVLTRPAVPQVSLPDVLTRPAIPQVSMPDVLSRPVVPQVSMPGPQPDEGPSSSASQPELHHTPGTPEVAEAAAAVAVGSGGAMDMMTVPLVPRGPGTSLTLPGSPPVNVLAMAAPERHPDGSLVAPRPSRGRPIRPGEKIPGVPGYRVPDGFRGRLLLDSQPPVGATGSTGVRISLGGGGAGNSRSHAMAAVSSSGGDAHASMTAFSQASPSSSSSGKSWGAGSNDCGFYNIQCSIVFGPYEQTKLCKPVHVAAVCCC